MTTCPEQGLLKAYADRELDRPRRQAVEEHLFRCQACQLALAQLESNAALVKGVLDGAMVFDHAIQPQPRRALDRCQEMLLTNDTVWDRIREGGRRMKLSFQGTGPRLAAMAAALCLCMIVLLAFEPVRLAAEDFLGVFRAEKFTAVTIDVNNPPEVPNPADLGTFSQPEPPKIHEVSVTEALSISHLPVVDLPEAAGLKASPTFMVSESAQYTFTFDEKKVKQFLASKGISGMVLPKNLDGATLKVNIWPVVTRAYGDSADAKGKHLMFLQTTSPTLEVPPDFDMELLRAQLLSSGLLPQDLASQLSAIEDWQSTAVIPVPSDANRRDVDVAGVPGLLISGPDYGAGVFWKRGDVIYGIAGNLSEEETLAVARSIK